MESLYHQTNRLIQETQHCFEKLEKTGDINSDSIEREIQARIDSVTSNCERLDILIYKEPLSRRTNGKLRIDQLKYDKVHLQAALDTYRNRKYQRLQEEREREALLNHHFEPNSYGETSIVMDQGQMFYAQKHQDSLQNANRGVDDMLQSGAGILENLRDQRMTIKGAHRRLYDIANTLGLSNTTMRLIERRAYQDKFILLGGMLFTLIVIGLVVVYFT
ncbi:probable Golgi SNAP receptor complex member 2 [Periplaneta americana]|uniref:probable Golgi SNAP receptor complex member 2 n=1 Tax=Periplaneta americana TaxID=6978 RepID=UPI0037E77FC3